MIGRTVLHYKILDKLGEGGMGEVYLAEDLKLKRRVALKTLPSSIGAESASLERFEREAQTLAALDHPNIVHIYSVELGDEPHFLTMQLVEGRHLSELIPEGGMEIERFFRIALPMVDALRAAHEKGITHRDLKPGNVMIDDERRVKILDFGLAKLRQPEHEAEESQLATETLTREGLVVGTVPYMSPEQVQSEPVDQRSDIFSLGVVLFEMATGRRPFQGPSAVAVASSILRDEPSTVAEVRPELPQGLSRVIGRCLAKEPRQRFQTAQDVYNELSELREGLRSGSSSAIGVEGATRQQPRRSLWGLAAVAAAAVLALYFAFDRGVGERPAAVSTIDPKVARSAIAIMPFTVRGSPAFAYLGEGLVDLLSTKLDGAGELRVVDPHAVLGYVSERIEGEPKLADARTLAEHFGAGLHVVGEVMEVGGQLHVSASLYRAGRAQPVSQASVEGSAEELFGLIDRLAAELVTEQVSGPGAGFARLAAVTTESLPALKLYLQGESELRSGQFTAAVDIFEQTVALDRDFALAWYRLSVAAEWAIRNDLVEVAATEAVRLSERLSERHQKLLEARLVSRQGKPEEAESLYRSILAIHPEDIEAWSQLAEVQSHYSHVTGRSAAESRQAWERIIELEPDLVLALWHLVRVEALERNHEALDAIVDRLLELTPEAERVLELRAMRAFVNGDVEEQQLVLDGLDGVTDAVVTLIVWNLSLVLDDAESTAAVARELIRPERSTRSQGLGHAAMAYLAVARGRWQEARVHLDRAQRVVPHLGIEHRAYLSSWELLPVSRAELTAIRDELLEWDAASVPPSDLTSFFFSATDALHPIIRIYLLGLIEARLGNEIALDYASQLEEQAATHDRSRALNNFAQSLRAAWWRFQGDDERRLLALERLESGGFSYQDIFASPFFSLPFDRFDHGRLAIESGDVETGRRLLSSLAEASFYDDSLVGLTHLYRGEIEASLGNTSEAEEHYRIYLELWPDPEPELASWRRRAEEGLARLSTPTGG